ncbi:MAG: hypothetical protein V4812_15915 [Pseudomonadota bacterium]
MNKSIRAPFLFLFSLLASCSVVEKNQGLPTAVDYESTVGWLHGNCLGIKNSGISEGSKIEIFSVDGSPHSTSATVLKPATTSEECSPLLEDRRATNLDNGYSFYLVEAQTKIQLGIGLLGDWGNTDEYKFNYCTTAEGIQYRLKKTIPANDEVVWSGYYYLGYDSEATCEAP